MKPTPKTCAGGEEHEWDKRGHEEWYKSEWCSRCGSLRDYEGGDYGEVSEDDWVYHIPTCHEQQSEGEE